MADPSGRTSTSDAGGVALEAREFVLASRAGDFAQQNPIFTLLPWLKAATLPEFLGKLPATPPDIEPKYRAAIQRIAEEFHRRAGTFTVAISERIKTLGNAKIVKLAHQPNLFSYSKLIGQFVALEMLAQNLENATPLYYFIDYDTVSNVRFSRFEMPDPTLPTGVTKVTLPSATLSHRSAVANRVAVPHENWFANCISRLKDSARVYESVGMCDAPVTPRLSRLLEDLDIARRAAINLADMNAILLSRYINLWLDIPIPFAPGSYLWSQIAAQAIHEELPNLRSIGYATEAAREFLVRCGIKSPQTKEQPMPLPWWRVCSCGSRVALHRVTDSYADGTCKHCNAHHSVPVSIEIGNDVTAPRILMHNLLNSSLFGYHSGVSHIGSAEHILLHSVALRYLGRCPLPQWLWECAGSFGTSLEEARSETHKEAISLVQSGNAAFSYFAFCQDPMKHRSYIEKKVMGI